MKAPGAAEEKPHWRVYPESFQKAYPKIFDEMRADIGHTHSSGPTFPRHNHRSLWLIDPFGVKDIPHADLEPLQNLPGAEVIINLDLGGLLRIKGAAEKALDDGDPDAFQAAIKAGNAKRLDLTWGSDTWREDLAQGRPERHPAILAQSYADTFPRFEFRSVYPLRGSRSQKRYLVHLTHVEVAVARFKGICDGCYLIDTLFAGDPLSQNQRATRAVQLFERFRGTTTTVPELYELGMGASRTQIAAICQSAHGRLRDLRRAGPDHDLAQGAGSGPGVVPRPGLDGDSARHRPRVLVPGPAVEFAPAHLRVAAAPLLEEEGHACLDAAVSQLLKPLDVRRRCPGRTRRRRSASRCPSSRRSVRGPSSGSAEMNRTAAGTSRR